MDCKKYRILIVDDELGWCKVLKSGLQENDFEIEYETKAANTLKRISSLKPQAVLLDVLFGNVNRGKKTFKDIKIKYPQLAVVMLTNTLTEEGFKLEDYPGCAFAYAKDQLKSGMDDVYMEFAEKISRAIKNTEATVESLEKEFSFVIGKTKAMQQVCKDIFECSLYERNYSYYG